jgi:hypothetical protein
VRELGPGGSPDLLWLRDPAQLPFEIDVFQGREHNDVVLPVGSKRAVISGDTLADFGQGLERALAEA